MLSRIKVLNKNADKQHVRMKAEKKWVYHHHKADY